MMPEMKRRVRADGKRCRRKRKEKWKERERP